MNEDWAGGTLNRLYARLGVRYLPLVLAWLGFLAAVGGLISVVIAARLLNQSYRPPSDLVWLVEAGIGVGCGVPFAFLWRDARPFVGWIRDGRPATGAFDAWQTAVQLIRGALPRCFVLTSVLLLPAMVWAAARYDLGAGGFATAWIFTELGVAVTATYMFFVGEAMLGPAIRDAGSGVLSLAGVRHARGHIRQKVLLALAVTTAFAVLVSQAIGSIGRSPASRMLGAVGIAVVISLTFTRVLIRAVADSVLVPISRLTEATVRAAAGDLEHRVPISSDDELGVLITNFNNMIIGLQEREGLRAETLTLSEALQDSIDDLHLHVKELRASRARVVAAADMERRRVERDLHDGAQEQLTLLGVKLAIMRSFLKEDPRAVAAHDELRADLSVATRQLRDLAHGIYPAVLVGQGLPAALEEAAGRSQVATAVSCATGGRYAPDVETAVYFCCLEALHNVAKHGGYGTVANIELRERSGWLIFRITDNGQGFETSRVPSNSGVQNMTDRIGALGGDLTIRSLPGAGTTVRGSVPLQQ